MLLQRHECDENGKLCGDIDFVCCPLYYPPVPGGLYDRHRVEQMFDIKNESVNRCSFVFDLDGTLSFDGVTIDDEIKQVLLRAEEFGHEVAFASARSWPRLLAF